MQSDNVVNKHDTVYNSFYGNFAFSIVNVEITYKIQSSFKTLASKEHGS